MMAALLIGILIWCTADVNASLDVTSEGRIRTVTTSLTTYFVDNGLLWKRTLTPYVPLLLLEGVYWLLTFRRTPLWTLGLMGLTVLAALGLEAALLQRLVEVVRGGSLLESVVAGPFTLGWAQGQEGPPFTLMTFPHLLLLLVLVSMLLKVYFGAVRLRSVAEPGHES